MEYDEEDKEADFDCESGIDGNTEEDEKADGDNPNRWKSFKDENIESERDNNGKSFSAGDCE